MYCLMFNLYYNFIIIIITHWEFFSSALANGLSLEFEWQQASRTLCSILADLSNAVVWIISTRPVISNSSSPCTNLLVTVPRAPVIIGIIVTFMFHSFFFNFLTRSRYLSFFSLSFNFTLWSAKSTIMQVLSGGLLFLICFVFCFLLFGLVVWTRLGDLCVSQNSRGVCVSNSPEQILACANTICLYGQISISCTVPSGSLRQPSHIYINIWFVNTVFDTHS